jgi:hypothetical protein
MWIRCLGKNQNKQIMQLFVCYVFKFLSLLISSYSFLKKLLYIFIMI